MRAQDDFIVDVSHVLDEHDVVPAGGGTLRIRESAFRSSQAMLTQSSQ